MRRYRSSPWLFLAFPLLVITVFTLIPTVLGSLLSLFTWNGGGTPVFVGFAHYEALFTGNKQFGHALRNTLLIAFVTVPITTLAAFALSVILNAPWFRGRVFIETVLFLPTVVSIVAVGFIWRWVLDPQSGALNGALRSLGLVDGDGPQWLGDTPWALGAIMFVHIWRNLGFCVLLYGAALTQIPKSLYEAAGIDGAGRWRTMVSVTWPRVRPMTAFLVITGTIWALQVFDLVWIVTGGAEQRHTDVLNTLLYREFSVSRLGSAAAIGVVVLVLSALVTIVQFRFFGRGEAARL